MLSVKIVYVRFGFYFKAKKLESRIFDDELESNILKLFLDEDWLEVRLNYVRMH